MKSILASLVLFALAAAPPAPAEEPAAPRKKGTFIVHWENDVIGLDDSDKHYTNGMQFTWQTPENRVWGWLDDWARRSYFPDPAVRLHASLSLGHNLYTPEDLDATLGRG